MVAIGTLSSTGCFVFKEPLQAFIRVGDDQANDDLDGGHDSFASDLGSDPGECVHGTAQCADDTRVEVCNRGQWGTPEPCAEGQKCLQGDCKSEWFEHRCVDSDDCRDGLSCWFGYCLETAGVDVGGECHSFFECAPGLNCASRSCQLGRTQSCTGGGDCDNLEEPYCSPRGQCQAGNRGQPCEGPRHCADGFACIERTHGEDEITHTIKTCEDGEATAGCATIDDCDNKDGFCLGYRCEDGSESSICGSEEHCKETEFGLEIVQMKCVRNQCQNGCSTPCFPDESPTDGEDHCQDEYVCAPACNYTGECENFVCSPGYPGDRCVDDSDCSDEAYCNPVAGPGACVDGQVSDWCDPEGAGQCNDDTPVCTSGGCSAGERGHPCNEDEHCDEGLVCVRQYVVGACYGGSQGEPCADDDPNDCLPEFPRCTSRGCQIGEEGSLCDDHDDCDDGLRCVNTGEVGDEVVCVDGSLGDICDTGEDCMEGLYCTNHRCRQE